MDFITIEVAKRDKLGSANAERARREGLVPAVLYGMKRPNIDLSIARSEITRFLKTGSHLVELKMGDKARPAILREMQTDPMDATILHVDFVRVDDESDVETEVPLNFKGRAKGESEGGVFTAVLNSIVVKARPKFLPRQYTIEIGELGVNEVLTLADIEQREGVSFVEPLTTVIANCAEPKAASEDGDAEGEGEGEAAGEAAAPAAE